jgi:hypothetical protein
LATKRSCFTRRKRYYEENRERINRERKKLDRRKVRRRFEERFTARRMANDYVRVYRSLVRHAAQRGRDIKYQVNGGARISGDELVSDVDKHAD